MLQIFATDQWETFFSNATQQEAIRELESGQILHFPELNFSLTDQEKKFLSPNYVCPKAKNISYNILNDRLGGTQNLTEETNLQLKRMLQRFSKNSLSLIESLLPGYKQDLIIARTSFRPVEIDGRKTSFRKDDKRLHIDAFPSSPNQGKRILRVFCNINPNGEPRIWRIGEPFPKVAAQFLPKIKKPLPGKLKTLQLLKLTKSYRTLYDHYMLHLHDQMKMNEHYQQTAEQKEIAFPAGSAWIVQTDDVSHAAMKGQHLLEQTFYLPVHAMQNANNSPLRILEKMLNCALV